MFDTVGFLAAPFTPCTRGCVPCHDLRNKPWSFECLAMPHSVVRSKCPSRMLDEQEQAWRVVSRSKVDDGARSDCRSGSPAGCSYARARATGLVQTGMRYKSGFVPCLVRCFQRQPGMGPTGGAHKAPPKRGDVAAAKVAVATSPIQEERARLVREAAANTNFFVCGLNAPLRANINLKR